MKLEVTVCNECRSLDKPTRKYRISTTDREIEVDLCEDDAKPIERYLPAVGTRGRRSRASVKRPGEPVPVDPGKARGRRSATPILTPQEIEERKAAQKAARTT